MPQNLLVGFPTSIPDEWVQTLVAGAHVRVERIVSAGRASPEGFWYDQEWGEWVLLVGGAARMRFDGGEPFDLKAGDYVDIPAHRRHRVEWTSEDPPAVWLAVHYE